MAVRHTLRMITPGPERGSTHPLGTLTVTPPRIAYVGRPDRVSPWLLRAIEQTATFEAICSPEAGEAARRYHARWSFDDLDAMLGETQPDGVILAIGPANRPAIIKQCLSAGIAVLVPDAPGPSAACVRLANIARLSGRTLLAASPLRFAPAVLLARRLIDSGRISEPLLATLHLTRRGQAREDETDRGCIPHGLAFEAMDVIHHLFDGVEAVSCMPQEDAAVAVVRAAGGVAISLMLQSNGAADAEGMTLEVRGRDGSRITIDADGRLLCGNGSRMHAAHRPTRLAADPCVEFGFTGMVEEFCRCLRLARSSSGMPGPAAAVTASAEALLASAAKGRPQSPGGKVRTKRTRAGTRAESAGLF